MKKIGKKISFLTKIMLVIGLLVSNLSSLSAVFAYETPDDVVITLEDNTVNIKYTELLAEDTQKVRVDVYESYTYLDDTKDSYPVVEYELDATQMESAKAGELELTHPKTETELFDGTYKVVVEIYKIIEELVVPENELESLENITPEVTEELITTATYEKEITYKSGLKLEVYDVDGDQLISSTGGKYVLSSSVNQIRVDAYLLAGGLAPSDKFLVEGVEYTATEIQQIPTSAAHMFDGKLYGEYSIPVSVEFVKVTEEVAAITLDEEEVEGELEIVPEETNNTLKYSSNISVMYGSYAENTTIMNSAVNYHNMTESYLFKGTDKNGILYNYIDLTPEEVSDSVTKTMLDLYKVMELVTTSDLVDYKLIKDNEDVIKKYNDTYNQPSVASEEDEEGTEVEIPEVITLEDYLKEILIDETVKVTLTSGDVTVSYSVVTLGDLNNDNTINSDDVLTLIELVLNNETNNDKANVDGLTGINNLDVLYLQEVIENKTWDITIAKEDAALDVELNTSLSEEETLVSGDEFTVDYILKLTEDEVSGFSGKVVYDKEVLELISVESLIDSIGNFNKDTGKFSYFGSESLELPEVEEAPSEPVEAVAIVEEETIPTVVTEDHAVLRVKFKVLKSGNHTVSIENTEYYNLATYLNTGNLTAESTVEVLESDDNTLSYLKVAGVEILLVEDTFEYEITVKNEVTLVDLEYILSNVAASVTSTIYPEELAVGANEVTITVVSESGISQDYKVIVTREEAPKTTTTQVNYNDYKPNYNEPEEEVVVPAEPVEPTEEKEKISISKIIIIILIVLVVAGLIYLIFKDDSEDDNDKKINNLKKETSDFEEVKSKKVNKTKNNTKNKNASSDKKTNNGKNTSNNSNSKPNNNKKKER